MFDLLTTVQYGGCSAKLPPDLLENLLRNLNPPFHKNLLVGIDTHDDAAVYQISEEQAIIFTADFFPPVCSDPYTFGQIAAANALSDVYAMGGEALIALNLIMFPSKNIDLTVLADILKGGQDKVTEANAIIAGGHTIDDFPPKYGLAVIGTIHPDHIVKNSTAKPEDLLILTKPIGTGTLMAAHRLKLDMESQTPQVASQQDYQYALQTMSQLNNKASQIMRKYNVRCATDVTGFSLLGHLLKMATASNVHMALDIQTVPLLKGALALTQLGCIPGASFRNQKYVEAYPIQKTTADYDRQMLCFDAQTSGGLLMSVPPEKATDIVADLKIHYPHTSIIGKVEEAQQSKWITF